MMNARQLIERAAGALWLAFGLCLAQAEAEVVRLSKQLDALEQETERG